MITLAAVQQVFPPLLIVTGQELGDNNNFTKKINKNKKNLTLNMCFKMFLIAASCWSCLHPEWHLAVISQMRNIKDEATEKTLQRGRLELTEDTNK